MGLIEERGMVLEMLQAGKITAADAAGLLEALVFSHARGDAAEEDFGAETARIEIVKDLFEDTLRQVAQGYH